MMIVDKAFLQEALKTAEKSAGDNRSIIEALSMIHLYNKGDDLYLESTNIEQAFRVRLMANNVSDIDILVNAKKFAQVVSTFIADSIKLGLTETQLLLTSGDQKAHLAISRDINDFPIIPEFPEQDFWVVGNDFVSILNSVAFSSTPNHTKPLYRSVHFETVTPTRLRIIAVDTGRVAVNECDTKTAIKEELNLMVPVKILKDFIAFAKGQGDIEMAFANNRLMLKIAEAVFMVTIYEDKFPDVMKGIATGFDESVQFDPKIGLQAAAAAEVFAKDNPNQPNFVKFNTKNGLAAFIARSEEGDMVAPFAVTADKDLSCDHGGDVALLKDALNQAQDSVKISFESSKGNKSVWHFTTPLWPSWQHIVMPMTIR